VNNVFQNINNYKGKIMSFAIALNPALKNLPVYQPGRPITEVARELGLDPANIIKMASNENSMGPSPLAVKAMQEALTSMNQYPDGNAFYLKQRLSKKMGVPVNQLAVGNGSNELLELIGHAVLSPGDEVVASQYSFAVYPIVAQLFGARFITVSARHFGHDLPAMLKAVTPQTKILFVANPNNPTGTMASRAELLQLIHEAPSHVLVVMDEAYIDFPDDAPDLIPYVRSGQHPNLLLCRTFSKIYGLAGLRVGFAMGHPEMIAALDKVRQPFNTNGIGQIGALAALDDTAHLEKTRINNKAGLAFFEKTFKRLNLEYVPSFANFILVKVGDGQKLSAELQKLGVITRPVNNYQLPEWLRITVGTVTENERCAAALEKVLRRSQESAS
jgi:histidinol-phosphate aminotransferase